MKYLIGIAIGIGLCAVLYNVVLNPLNHPALNCDLVLGHDGIYEQCHQEGLAGDLSQAHNSVSGSILASYYKDIGTTLSVKTLVMSQKEVAEAFEEPVMANVYSTVDPANSK